MRKILSARWLRSLSAGAVLLVAMLGVANLATDDKLCQQARVWASEHRDALPSTLSSLRMYPALYRRAIVPKVPSHVRSALWMDHLAEVKKESLTADQRSIVWEFNTLVIDAEKNSASRANLDACLDRAAKAFSPAEYRRIFSEFGEPNGRPRSLSSAYIALQVTVRSLVDPSANAGGDCECRRHQECPGFPADGCFGNISCDPVPGACDAGLDCTGICEPF